MSPHVNSVPCSQVQAALSAYVDGEPCAVEHNIIHHHLDACPACLAESEVIQLIKVVVARSCCAEPAPERVRARVIAQITRIQVQITRSEPGD
ncbi:MAG: mycothiol system anti-sigma-R factor [Actinobacteria bacterium]|uniref:Unannotated protein n=1 Tax=freshwater metagenome TaxID=449393 RepID=A0A6J5Z589_9ZZZZ|nr:mycothiol system anti-sigma-R factor [Actinomycetota bacterium]